MALKTSGVGHFTIPTAPAVGTAVAQSGSANTFGSAVSMGSTPAAIYISGVHASLSSTSVPTYVQIQILAAAAVVGTYVLPIPTTTGATGTKFSTYVPIDPPIAVANAVALTAKSASDVASALSWGVTLLCINQANVIVETALNENVNVINVNGTSQTARDLGLNPILTAAQIATGVWQDTTAGDFTTALSVGKSVMNGVTLGTGLTVNSLTNLPAITANWITAAGINASALNGKGDWATTNPTNLTAAQIATGVWQDTTAGDFTLSASVGKSLMNGVALGTGLTVATATNLTNLPSITAGWLTATGIASGALNGKGDWMLSYTQPTGFLAATFPSGTVANTTNITGGTITTTTNLTNLPSITAGWLTATGIASGALNGKGDWMVSFTLPTNFSSFSIDSSGRVDVIKINGASQTAKDLGYYCDHLTSGKVS